MAPMPTFMLFVGSALPVGLPAEGLGGGFAGGGPSAMFTPGLRTRCSGLLTPRGVIDAAGLYCGSFLYAASEGVKMYVCTWERERAQA